MASASNRGRARPIATRPARLQGNSGSKQNFSRKPRPSGPSKPYEPFNHVLIQNDLEKDLRRLFAIEDNKDAAIEFNDQTLSIDRFMLKARCSYLMTRLDKIKTLHIQNEESTNVTKDKLADFIRDMYSACNIGKGAINQKAKDLFQFSGANEEDNPETLIAELSINGNNAEDSCVKTTKGCCPLGEDLLAVLDDKETSDLLIKVGDNEIHVHRQLLAIRSSYFEAMLHGDWSETDKMIVNLKNVSYKGVLFVLQFIYGGVCDVPDDVSDSEILQIADMYGLDILKDVISHHLKQKYCHNFHKPCATCVPGIIDVIQLSWTFGPKELYRDCVRWICRHYSKVYTCKEFIRLRGEIQTECTNAIIESLTPSIIIQQLKECEVMEARLPHVKSIEPLRVLVQNLERAFFGFMVSNLDAVVTTPAFLDLLKGVGWSDKLLEKILSEIEQSLSVSNCCSTLTCLQRVLKSIDLVETMATKESNVSPFSREAKQQLELAEKSCLTFIGNHIRSLQTTSAWKELESETKQRIKENSGFFDLSTIPAKTSMKRDKQSAVRSSRSVNSPRQPRVQR